MVMCRVTSWHCRSRGPFQYSMKHAVVKGHVADAMRVGVEIIILLWKLPIVSPIEMYHDNWKFLYNDLGTAKFREISWKDILLNNETTPSPDLLISVGKKSIWSTNAIYEASSQVIMVYLHAFRASSIYKCHEMCMRKCELKQLLYEMGLGSRGRFEHSTHTYTHVCTYTSQLHVHQICTAAVISHSVSTYEITDISTVCSKVCSD